MLSPESSSTSSEDEGDTAGVEEVYGVPELLERQSGERFDLIIVGESKSEQVGPLSRRFLSAGEWENGVVVECTVV